MSAAARLGRWAAWTAFAASAAYTLAQLLQIAGLLPDPIDRIAIFVPSFALAPAFVVALAMAYACAPVAMRGWRLAAFALALLYAAMAGIVYVNQLGVVIPDELHGVPHDLDGLACCAFRAPITAIDLLGYSYMGLALLLLAPSYSARWLRAILIANGVLVPAILLQLYWPMLIVAAAPWLILFPAAMALLAGEFGRRHPAHAGLSPRSVHR